MTFEEHLERASEIVASWPAWKRNVLGACSRPTRNTPRKPVNNAEPWRLRHLFALMKLIAHPEQEYEVDLVELIARRHGWPPLTQGEMIRVHYLGREYEIRRTE